VDGEAEAGVEGKVVYLKSRTADFAVREPYHLVSSESLLILHHPKKILW
jgi:hypothetical protein